MDALVRTSGLRGYPALMRAMGCDPAPLLRRYHVDEGALDSDDAMISLRAVVHLLEASAEQTRPLTSACACPTTRALTC
jgi:hypothetical protein